MDVNDSSREILFSLMFILCSQPRCNDLLLFGQYIAAKISPQTFSEKELDLATNNTADPKNSLVTKNINMRNRCLSLLHTLLFTARNAVNTPICDEITKVLGMDWILLFMQPHVHSTTVIWALRILVVLCANDTFMSR